MSPQVWLKARERNGDIVFFTKRWWLPRWFPGSAKFYGNLTSIVNSMETKLNVKCEEIEDLLFDLEQARKHERGELKAVTTDRYNRDGDTDWYLEDLKYLVRFKKYVAKPSGYYKEVLNPAFMRKFGISKTAGKTKKSSHGDIPDNLVGTGERSIYVLPGESSGAKNALEADLGADNVIGYRPPEKKKKQSSGSKNGHWKNRRKGESEDEYDERMEEGE